MLLLLMKKLPDYELETHFSIVDLRIDHGLWNHIADTGKDRAGILAVDILFLRLCNRPGMQWKIFSSRLLRKPGE